MVPTEKITSLSNARVKSIRKLRERKERERTGLFYIEGLRIVAEATQLEAGLEFLVAAPDLLESKFGEQLLREQAEAGVPVLEVSAEVFKSFALKEGPQGIGAVVRQRWVNLAEVALKPGDCWVALDAVQDPGNLGTILRTHDSVGGSGLILLDQSTDPYDPTAVRASMGAVFSQRLVKASFAEFAAWKKSHPYAVIATSGAAQEDYHQVVYPDPLIVLMGSERLGLLEQHLALSDRVVKIPMQGRSDSLNLAVATAVVLYEIYNQRRDAERSTR